jgi:hypothetical protein
MKKKKVNFMMLTSVDSIEGPNIQFSGVKGEGTLEFDSVIMAVLYPEDGIWRQSANSLAKEVYFIGDAKKPRRLLNAIHDGYRLGMVI